MIEKMHLLAGGIVASEITLALGFIWAIKAHLV